MCLIPSKRVKAGDGCGMSATYKTCSHTGYQEKQKRKKTYE